VECRCGRRTAGGCGRRGGEVCSGGAEGHQQSERLSQRKQELAATPRKSMPCQLLLCCVTKIAAIPLLCMVVVQLVALRSPVRSFHHEDKLKHICVSHLWHVHLGLLPCPPFPHACIAPLRTHGSLCRNWRALEQQRCSAPACFEAADDCVATLSACCLLGMFMCFRGDIQEQCLCSCCSRPSAWQMLTACSPVVRLW